MQHHPIVALGARIKHGQPGGILTQRLRVARDLYHQHPRTVIVTGSGEAHVMAAWLRDNGVAAGDIVEEPAATSTNENLENAWALIDDPSATMLTVVTNNFHALRTKVWAWHLGIPVVVVEAPTPRGAKWKNYTREIIALPHSIARVMWRRIKAALCC